MTQITKAYSKNFRKYTRHDKNINITLISPMVNITNIYYYSFIHSYIVLLKISSESIHFQKQT